MPKPSWVTFLFKLLGVVGKAATDANEVFPNAGHRVPVRESRPLKAAALPVNDPNGNVVKLVTKARRRKVGKDVTRLDEQ
jgi:hypothetical protein